MSDAPILSGVTRIEDIEAASDFEKKHTPYVAAERVDGLLRVLVKVGHYVEHPNQPDHFIEWVDLLVNGLPVARATFGAVVAHPEVTLLIDVEPGSKLTAMESCNLHGLWAWDVIAP